MPAWAAALLLLLPDAPGLASALVLGGRRSAAGANTSALLGGVQNLSFTHRFCRRPNASLQARTPVRLGRRLVGASIAVHPPKFYAAAKFLEQYASCPGAMQAMAVFLVLTSEQDLRLFRDALACLAPDLPADAWTAVVAEAPAYGSWGSLGGQRIAAHKKWQGIAHMLDLGAEAPEYGLMMDSELLLFDEAGGDVRGEACAEGGPWAALLPRIREREAARRWPAARVSDTLVQYNFSQFDRQSGAKYDQGLLRESAQFVADWGEILDCTERGCAEVKKQVDDVLFSWWTDLPWLNLTVASRMLQSLRVTADKNAAEREAKRLAARGEQQRANTTQKAGNGSAADAPGAPRFWRELCSRIPFARFEYLNYQQWCMLNEGFSVWDVTNITGQARWGSYMEDPLPGARLDLLQPLWVSSQAIERSENGKISKLSAERPPLMIFHADQGMERAHREKNKNNWKTVLLPLLALHGRHDYDKGRLE